MAEDGLRRAKTRHRKHDDTDTSKSRKRSEDDKDTATTKSPAATTDRPADILALREARLAYIAKDPEEKRKDMKYEYVKRSTTVAQAGDKKERRPGIAQALPDGRDVRKPERRATKRTDTSRRQARQDGDDDGYVYSRSERAPARDAARSNAPKRKTTTVDASPRKAEERRTAPERRHTAPARRKVVYNFDEECTDQPKPPPRRDSSVVEKSHRPEIKRSATTTKAKTEVSAAKASEATAATRRTSTLFGGILPPKPAPQKKVSCLTCGADDIPIARAALLPCKHRMCNSCLKRIFTMSVTDPAHMPPRCCTDQHIDLKHVEKLFDDKFKVLWNRKFQEYKTKNRIYCPGRKCGAWIKPHYIALENGRKVGRCKQCKLKVCAICSQKMHTTRECPKDPETKAFIETAKEQGWQRCYSCHAMVELKEGCNHMTCRCTAEFCMVCGMKWKSCDCPWFNYEAVDAHLGDPVRHQQEIDRRRDQINRDEELARRMQQLGVAADDAGGAFGLGNGADHHMNQNFIQQAREALTANYAQANRAARDLLNGFVMGRENQLPGMPLQMDQMMELLGQGRVRDPGEGGDEARRPRRRGTARRRTAAADTPDDGTAGMDRREERRIQDWANDVG
ncbi:hypothetical protein A1O7_04076 [Cladophialophora yegresii CBS 114405]|uniref:RBR-type E3 ubiquitin transferase n=1 Tax=Cladophialophora yegresii CBS 114405 TaxID=1182544 RepID=W9VW91_9EURO|nr:uncharacterized protein A1O7_04076 [Cladophialophora yegresii CBS 114405]EXJ59928.1 hypothetical protein A1O7_04076 [Cladophialophora yegresii CBS 114405]